MTFVSNETQLRCLAVSLLAALLLTAVPALAAPQGTAFTYQGRLFDQDEPATGTYHFEFSAYDAVTAGSLEAGPVSVDDVSVVEGYFTVDIDFGVAFVGQLLYLETDVAPDGGSFTTLSPRQAMQSVPNALYSLNADALDGFDASEFLMAGDTVDGGLDFDETHFSTDSSTVYIGFENGTGSIAGYGLRIEGAVLQAKGTLIGVEAETAVESVGHPQQGRAIGRLAYTSGFDLDGNFFGAFGVGFGETLSNNFSGATSEVLGGRFFGQPEDGTTLNLDGTGTYWVGGALGRVQGTIDGDAGSGAVAGVIGVDDSSGSATSWAGYFEGTLYASGHVGIGTTDVEDNILTVKQGSDTDPIADAWTVYSSRRYKDDIQVLEGALDAVRQLRGVTWKWKTSGRRDLGLVAEEVGSVFPEVVAWEDNGVDAQGLDYSRLVAVLIEAVKEQQTQIDGLTATLCAERPGSTACSS